MPDLIIDSSNVVEILGVTNGKTAAAITTATILFSLFDASDDSAVTGETWPVTLVHDTGGDYRYTLSYLLDLSPCTNYRGEFSVDDGAGFHREWEAIYPAVYGSITAELFVTATDQVLSIVGLEDATSPGTYINSATPGVFVTLTDLSDVEIVGETWPLQLTYEATSDGNYDATLRDTLDVAAGDVVKVLLTADDGAGYHREWRSILTVQTGT